MHSANTAEQIEKVRQHTVVILDALVAKAGEFQLADPPPALERYRRKLRENTYKVLVAGEAKRGKSTFVNALIGRNILPTDVGIVNSQVFSVRPSEREAYRLRFEDGSVQEISREDLPLYGSQQMHDNTGLVSTSGIIRWIEVDVPVRFLPRGISILDTPGLGSLYAGHAQITHRFVPEADAVIFVLESGQPLVFDDLRFIEQILTVTRNIFFIQTKIDQYNKEDWQDVQRRNQEILAKQFKGRLVDTRVWPVSSTNLLKAASADERTEQAYLMVSRHKELAAALRAFLSSVSGWGQAVEAMTVAAPYYATGHKVLAGRVAGLTAESKQKQAELQKIAVEAKRRFEAEWGPEGRKYQQLREELKRAIALGKQSFSNTLQPGNDIELAQKAKIEAVSSLEEARRVAEEMPGEVATATMNNWARVCEEVQQRCVMLLGPFVEAVEDIGALVDADLSGLSADSDIEDKFKHDYFTMFRSAAGGGMLMMGASGMTAMVLPATATAAFTTVVPFVAIPALAVLVGGGVKSALKGQLKNAKMQLKTQLMELLQKVRRHFFDVDLTAGSFSRVDEYFRSVERAVNQQVRELVQKKSKESQAEIARLEEAMQLNDRQRQAQLRVAQEQLAQWDNIAKSAKQLMAHIEALKQQPRTPAKA